jgi:histidyl-tRNA synthetase
VVYVVAVGERAREQAFSLAHDLRTQGIDADLDYVERSAKGQMKQAGRMGALQAFIIGEDELAQGSVTVRDLQSGSESTLPRVEALRLAAARNARG